MSGNVIEFVIRGKDAFTGPISKVTASLATVGAQASAMGGKLRGAVNSMVSLRSAMGLLAGTTGAGLMARSFLDAASTTEQLQVRLGVLLGSTEQGGILFNKMADFAGRVPFKLEEINASATQLAGIMRGGQEEISQWMPLIGDLAATTGLSIQTATEQVSRMLSAGANSADLFRERGVLAMLGFEAGVTISAEDTKKKLISSWQDQNSQFAGATAKLAETWEGTMSMLGDKWFQFRMLIMDAGVFKFIKAIAAVIDERMGAALKNGGDAAKLWGQKVIDAIKWAGSAVGVFLDGLRGIEVMWGLLKIGAHFLSEAVWVAVRRALGAVDILVSAWTAGINAIIDGLNMIPGVAINAVTSAVPGILSGIDKIIMGVRQNTEILQADLATLAGQPLPSEGITKFFDDVTAKANASASAVADAADANRNIDYQSGGGSASTEDNDVKKRAETSEKLIEQLRERLLTEAEIEMEQNDERQRIIIEAHALTQIEDEEFNNLMQRQQSVHTGAMIQIQKKGFTDLQKFQAMSYQEQTKTVTVELAATLGAIKTNNKAITAVKKAAGIAQAMMNTYIGVSQTIATYPFPWVIPIAAAHLAMGLANVASISGSAAGGLTKVPDQGTFTLHAGERILSPRQNIDLTDFLGSQQQEVPVTPPPPPIMVAQSSAPVAGDAESGDLSNSNSTTIEAINIHILENATSGAALLDMDENDWREIVARNIIPAFNDLDNAGVRPRSIERQRDA